jgi:hypothetical protein
MGEMRKFQGAAEMKSLHKRVPRPLKFKPMLGFLVRKSRRELLSAFSNQQIPSWYAESWLADPEKLYRDLEKLQKSSPTAQQSDLITQAQIALLLQHARKLGTVTRVYALLSLARSGLKYRTSGQLRHEHKKSQTQKRDAKLKELARDKFEKNPQLFASDIAKLLIKNDVRAKFVRLGLLEPPGFDGTRKVISGTIRALRKHRRLSVRGAPPTKQ